MSSGAEVSVLVVSRRRADLLERCLTSLADQSAPPRWELLVAADDDAAVEATVADSAVADRAAVVHTTGLSLAANRNLIIAKATAPLLLFLDDDVVVGPTYLADLVTLASSRPWAAVFGGPNLTPAGASRRAEVQGRLLGSWWLTGPIAARYRPLARERETRGVGLTLCNLAVRTETDPFLPPGQRGGEENVMLADLRRRGFRMLRHPLLTVEHERRPTMVAFVRQIHKYGFGRGEALASDGWRRARSIALGVAMMTLVCGRRRVLIAGGAGIVVAVAGAGWRASPDGSHQAEDGLQAAVVPVGYVAGLAHGFVRATTVRLSGRGRRASRG